MANPVQIVDGAVIKSVTLSLDTNAYADNDVLAAAQQIDHVAREPGGAVTLDSVTLNDEDDQGQDIDLIFADSAITIGTENAAVSISDADSRSIVGLVSIAAADYADHINSQCAVKTALGLTMQCASDTTSLWVAAVLRSGTPTYTASGIRLKLGFTRH